MTTRILLTAKQVAEQLNVAPRTVYEWAESGRLGYVRLGKMKALRFRQSTVDAFVEDREIKAEVA